MNPFYPTHHNHLSPFNPNQAQHFNSTQISQFSGQSQSQVSPNSSSVLAAAQFYARSNHDQFRHRIPAQAAPTVASPNTVNQSLFFLNFLFKHKFLHSHWKSIFPLNKFKIN